MRYKMSQRTREALLFATVVLLVAATFQQHELALYLMDSDGMLFSPIYPAAVAAGPVLGYLLGSATQLLRGARS